MAVLLQKDGHDKTMAENMNIDTNDSKEKLLKDFVKIRSHNTLESEQYTAAIIVKSASDLGKSLDDFRESVEKIGESSDRLSRRLVWLNCVLTVATVIGVIAAVITVSRKFL